MGLEVSEDLRFSVPVLSASCLQFETTALSYSGHHSWTLAPGTVNPAECSVMGLYHINRKVLINLVFENFMYIYIYTHTMYFPLIYPHYLFPTLFGNTNISPPNSMSCFKLLLLLLAGIVPDPSPVFF